MAGWWGFGFAAKRRPLCRTHTALEETDLGVGLWPVSDALGSPSLKNAGNPDIRGSGPKGGTVGKWSVRVGSVHALDKAKLCRADIPPYPAISAHLWFCAPAESGLNCCQSISDFLQPRCRSHRRLAAPERGRRRTLGGPLPEVHAPDGVRGDSLPFSKCLGNSYA